MNKVVFKSFEAFVEEMPGWITRSLIYNDNSGIKTMRLGMIILEPNTTVGAHRHNCEELLYILSGRGIITVDGKEYEVEKGDSVYIKENLLHGPQKNTGDKELKYLYVVSLPLRPATSEDVVLPNGERVKPKKI